MKLNQLIAICKCGVHLTVNDHRDNYQSVAKYFEQRNWRENEEYATPEVMQRMIDTDTIIHLQFYPLTPIGFHEVWHYDLDAALDEAIRLLGSGENGQEA